MTPNAGIDEISTLIQLAIAPVFLLTAVGTLIGVQTNRLARAVDRARILEERRNSGGDNTDALASRELQVLRSRMRLIYVGVVLNVICALFVGLTIVLAFTEAFVGMSLTWLVAVLFVAAMLSLIGSLAVFLREMFLAVRNACAVVGR